jgi:hypothetical protein
VQVDDVLALPGEVRFGQRGVQAGLISRGPGLEAGESRRSQRETRSCKKAPAGHGKFHAIEGSHCGLGNEGRAGE